MSDTKNNPRGIKLRPEGSAFLVKLRKNRVKANTDESTLGFSRLIDIIYQYFKNHDKNYKELLIEEYKKDA